MLAATSIADFVWIQIEYIEEAGWVRALSYRSQYSGTWGDF